MQGAEACMQAPHLRWFLSTHRLWLVADGEQREEKGRARWEWAAGTHSGNQGGLTARGRPPGAPHSPLTGGDRKSTRLNSSHSGQSRMPSSA